MGKAGRILVGCFGPRACAAQTTRTSLRNLGSSDVGIHRPESFGLQNYVTMAIQHGLPWRGTLALVDRDIHQLLPPWQHG